MDRKVAYNPDITHNVDSDNRVNGVVMSSKESSMTRVWREKGNNCRRVVIQFPNISAEQGIIVKKEVCEMIESLLSQRMNQISDDNGGTYNE